MRNFYTKTVVIAHSEKPSKAIQLDCILKGFSPKIGN
ncbi:hypothetical protein F963_00259 [Acinetobacter bereziniae NIPH 3]|uniref:Uncharacterized protein n=1 Tax=Acinetobacter bereziniae NIPH 3 TaxID=1217651 RepID=N8YVI4_ACIBZ|nr:hypothetical protein F963_00259 [Acinetobacter bereziniae NIPH 3]